jgi:putative aldouronate transport system substrate-binding protein
MKRTLGLLFILLFAVSSILAGCGGQQAADQTAAVQTEEQPNGDTGTTQDDNQQTWLKKYDPPITFTQNKVDDGSVKMHEGDGLENNGITRWIKEEVGIIVKPKWAAPNSDTDIQKLNLGAASGDLPDVIGGTPEILGKLAAQGALLPLDDLIEKYASPLTKYVIEESMKDTQGKLFTPFTINGKIYAMPKAIDRMAYWQTNWIRKDILDELGKQMPQTLAELEDVLAAYKAKYPNNPGFLLNKDLNLELVMQAYEAYPKKWHLDETGNVVYGSVQPQVKEGLKTLNEWYQKGYIDKEFVVKNSDNLVADFTAGNALTWSSGAWWNVWFPFPDLWKNVSNAEMVAMPTLKGPDGQRGMVVDMVPGYGVAINKNYKNPEAIFYLYNEQLDSIYRSNEKVREEMKKRGYEFKYPVTEWQQPLNPDEINADLFMYNYEKPGFGWFNDFRDNDSDAWGFQGRLGADFVDRMYMVSEHLKKGEVSGLPPAEQKEVQGFASDPGRIKTFPTVMDSWKEREAAGFVKPNIYPGVPTPTMVQKKAYLDKLESETFAKIIMGQEPTDAFDKFVETWKSNGGDEITKELNDWYQANK